MIYLENNTTGEIGAFANYQIGWSPANPADDPVPQNKIDDFLTGVAQRQKKIDLKNNLDEFLLIGYVFEGHTYQLSDKTTDNIQLKNNCSPTMPNRYNFCDKENVLVDFTDAAGWTAFVEASLAEKDRVMVKYNAYKVQIAACATVAEVDAITIDFSV